MFQLRGSDYTVHIQRHAGQEVSVSYQCMFYMGAT